MQCLIEAGVAKQEIIDPTGAKIDSSPTNSIYTYMKNTCGNPAKTYIYAKLENIPQSSSALDSTCSPGWDTAYGMNYYGVVE
jgi:hypothetical protein